MILHAFLLFLHLGLCSLQWFKYISGTGSVKRECFGQYTSQTSTFYNADIDGVQEALQGTAPGKIDNP